jgi:drug/metabolite transporter (DMT)-like permease
LVEGRPVPTFLSGLPLHPLVVHAVVVLVPAAVIGAVLVAVWPATRRRWGWPTVVLTALAAISVPLATSTGEGLEHNLPRTPAIAVHTELGDQLLVFVGPLFVVVLALVLLDHRRHRSTHAAVATARADGPGTMTAPRTAQRPARVATVVLAVLTVLLAAASAVQVVRIGDSGARAAWGDIHYTPQPRHTRVADD